MAWATVQEPIERSQYSKEREKKRKILTNRDAHECSSVQSFSKPWGQATDEQFVQMDLRQ